MDSTGFGRFAVMPKPIRFKSMRTKSKTGLAILAGGLSFVGAANAIDLIQNGSFESIAGGTPQYGGITDGTAPGWNGGVSTLPYSGTIYFAGPAIPASESPGSFYLWRHPSALDRSGEGRV